VIQLYLSILLVGVIGSNEALDTKPLRLCCVPLNLMSNHIGAVSRWNAEAEREARSQIGIRRDVADAVRNISI
jgi:hypothetical protein